MKDTLLSMVPSPPDWSVPWDALRRTSLGALLLQMAGIRQNPAYHGEGDVLTHTKLVCEALAGLERFRQLDERRRQAVFLAALLHDVGKITCTRFEDGRWTSPRHAAAGAAMARELLPDFSIELLCLLVRADILGRICGDQAALLEAVELCELLAEEQGCLAHPRVFPSRHTAFSYFSGRLDVPDCELYDDTWGEAVLMCGLPGTGKDTWIKEHCPELPVVSLDAVRAELGVSPAQPQKRVADEARALLRGKQPLVWNATSVTADLRRGLVELFTDYHASVRVVYLETEWEEELRRNAGRAAVVPEAAVRRMLARLRPPEPWEAHHVEWRCV